MPSALQWDDRLPPDRQLQDRVAAMIAEGVLTEGDRLPSVGSVAEEFGLNPRIVLKAYQQLFDEQLVEKRRGRGMYAGHGAREVLARKRTPSATAG
jgi:GntR family transcriptional regulator